MQTTVAPGLRTFKLEVFDPPACRPHPPPRPHHMLNTLKTRFADPRGSALVPALMITVMMLAFGMAMLSSWRATRPTRAASASASPPSSSPRACSTRRSTGCRRAGRRRSRRCTRPCARRRRRKTTARARSTGIHGRGLHEGRRVEGPGPRQQRSRSTNFYTEDTSGPRHGRAGPQRRQLPVGPRRGHGRRPQARRSWRWSRPRTCPQLPQRDARGRQVRGLQHRQQGHDRHERRLANEWAPAISSCAATSASPAARSGTRARARSSRTRSSRTRTSPRR